MRETVMIQVGQCGNQIGNQFWNLLLKEHEHSVDSELALSSFFKYSDGRGGRNKSKQMKARALLIDMECGPLQQTMKGPLGHLFDETQFVMDVYGAGNNFAHGHMLYGPQYRDRFEEGLRKNAEQCDSLQTFVVTHSLGGGTGSGVGTYVLGLLEDFYPEVYRFSACVFPSSDDDVITSPYNSVLASRYLIDHSDCVLPIDNHALQAFAAAEAETLSKAVSKLKDSRAGLPNQSSSARDYAGSSADKGFNEMNGVAARMLCHLTSSSRFHGDMNVDMNEICTNLIPFPHLKFLMTAMSIQRPASGSEASASEFFGVGETVQKKRSSSTGRSLRAGSGASNTTARASGSSTASSLAQNKILIQRAFHDVLSRTGQITDAVPCKIGGEFGRDPVCMASAFLARGKNIPFTDFLACVTTAQKSSLKFPNWNPDACKIGMCSVAAPGEQLSVLGVYNSTSFGTVLRRMRDNFNRLYKRKAMVHHYTEFMDIGNFAEAESAISAVIASYDALEHGKIPIWTSRKSIDAERCRKEGGDVDPDTDTHQGGEYSQRVVSSVPFLGDNLFTFDQYCIDKLFPAF